MRRISCLLCASPRERRHKNGRTSVPALCSRCEYTGTRLPPGQSSSELSGGRARPPRTRSPCTFCPRRPWSRRSGRAHPWSQAQSPVSDVQPHLGRWARRSRASTRRRAAANPPRVSTGGRTRPSGRARGENSLVVHRVVRPEVELLQQPRIRHPLQLGLVAEPRQGAPRERADPRVHWCTRPARTLAGRPSKLNAPKICPQARRPSRMRTANEAKSNRSRGGWRAAGGRAGFWGKGGRHRRERKEGACTHP